MADAVYTKEILLTVADAEEDKEKANGKKKQRKSGDEGEGPGKGKDAPTHGLPAVKLLTKDGRDIDEYGVEPWPEDFTEADGGTLEDLGNGEVIYKVNYDNAYRLKYRLSQHGSVAREVGTEKFILGMRILFC